MKSKQTPYPEGYKDLQRNEMGSADYTRKRSCGHMGSFGSKSAINQTWHSREGYKPSVPWLRARERYRLRNSITGVVLIGFIGGVYWYTIKAVDQDTFEDVPMPPAPALPTSYPGVRHKNLDDSLEGVKKKI